MKDNKNKRHLSFSAEQWGQLRAATPLTLDEADLEQLRGINVSLSLDEVVKIYLPLSRLLNLYVAAAQDLYRASSTFLGELPGKVPFIIGIAGSVAVGKSTTARLLQALLARWPNTPKVDLVTTDGFLFSNKILADRGLTERKGFPESYDRRRLLEFLESVKCGDPESLAPVYSHLVYDTTDRTIAIKQPDILIVEGLNVLQTGSAGLDTPVFVSDYFDFTIYVDAEVSAVQEWYVERFFTLRETAFRDPKSFFRRFSELSDAEAKTTAEEIWQSINEKNLYENILPTRNRADLILNKALDHSVSEVLLRRP